MKCKDKIKALRKEVGWSQEELGKRCMVSRQAVSLWESQDTYPDIENLILLSELFHVTIDDLVKNSHALPHTDTRKDQIPCIYQNWMNIPCYIHLKGYTSWDQTLEPTILLYEDNEVLWFMQKTYLLHKFSRQHQRKEWNLGIVRKSMIEKISVLDKKKMPESLLEIPEDAKRDPYHFFLHKNCNLILRSDTWKDNLFKDNNFIDVQIIEHIQDHFYIQYHKDRICVAVEQIAMINEI